MAETSSQWCGLAAGADQAHGHCRPASSLHGKGGLRLIPRQDEAQRGSFCYSAGHGEKDPGLSLWWWSSPAALPKGLVGLL